MASCSKSECCDAMASLDNVLASHILDWICSEGFDKVMEAKFNGVCHA